MAPLSSYLAFLQLPLLEHLLCVSHILSTFYALSCFSPNKMQWMKKLRQEVVK